jgi:hypothetical protein
MEDYVRLRKGTRRVKKKGEKHFKSLSFQNVLTIRSVSKKRTFLDYREK